jgi:hypothetical protein
MAGRPSFISSFTRTTTDQGFAFTADAALAVIIFVLATTALSQSGIYEPMQPLTDLEIKRNMTAAVEILDENGSFDAMAAGPIANDFNALLPRRIGWRLKAQRYVRTPSSFTLSAEVLAGDWATDLNELNFIQGRRLSMDFNSTDVTFFKHIEWRAWIK